MRTAKNNNTPGNQNQIIPEFHISLKMKAKPSELITITDTESAANAARRCFDADSIEWVESFIVIALNRANKALGFYKISSGGITATVADPKVILQFALLSNATSIILVHNHPSGNLKPSFADEQLTKKIDEAASYLDIKVLDHIIVTTEGSYSFVDEGLL
ncbi:MAG TPA: JAB domain-containing protein [Cytophaga sp.]|jgi:DNA repair protein RadC|nr:JAB domain-containing protein [Cytophaga sp.]